MASIRMSNIKKIYSGGKIVMEDFNLFIKDSSFTVLVGPSGCGKTTAIRIISGLEDIQGGSIYIGDKDVTKEDPGDRGIAMVFQNYALYPHMTVERNISFGLKNYGFSKSEIDEKVNSVLELVGLKEYRNSKPANLSGGQRQRVALARAISKNPDVFLMDEPLSNLDAKLRVQMRSELVRLHKKLNTTFVYITHDQIEALTMADYIIVMNEGKIMQYGTAQDVYENPENLFTAKFIGESGMNTIKLNDGNYIGFRANKIFKEKPENFNGITFSAPISTKERLGSDFNYTILYEGEEISYKTDRELEYAKTYSYYIQYEDLYAFDKSENRIDINEISKDALENSVERI
ncbi:ABC-type transport system, sugar-family ATP-binding protein [Peptoniphilus sp. ING2-D1G]|nr:ABC-type transport system, sugar-family ATP-binding protein [Peptoniphilus sp. ING2-D1G]